MSDNQAVRVHQVEIRYATAGEKLTAGDVVFFAGDVVHKTPSPGDPWLCQHCGKPLSPQEPVCSECERERQILAQWKEKDSTLAKRAKINRDLDDLSLIGELTHHQLCLDKIEQKLYFYDNMPSDAEIVKYVYMAHWHYQMIQCYQAELDRRKEKARTSA